MLQWRTVTSEASHAIGMTNQVIKLGIFKTNFRPRFKVVSKKKGHHLKSFLGKMQFSSQKCSDL